MIAVWSGLREIDRSEETDDVDLRHDAAPPSRSFEFAGGMVR